MKHFFNIAKIITSISVMMLMTLGTVFGIEGVEKNNIQKFDSKPIKGESNGQERFVSIDFNNVDLNVFIKFISELSGKNFVVDDRVKGKVTIISPAKISEKEAFKVFESVLEVHGYSTVEAGEVIKIVSSPDARTKNVETYLTDEGAESTDKLVTQLIPLKYADANEIKQLFAPLVSKNSVILAYTQTNMLIVTDIYSNIQRLLRILSAVDVTGIGREITIIPLESADSSKLVKLLETVFKKENPAVKKKSENGREIAFVADERTNTIVLLASEADTLRVKRLIRMLDKDVPRGKENIHVYYLEYANAEELAKVLQMLPSKTETADAKGKKAPPVVSGTTKITADKATNSLILMADKDDYLTMEEIIRKLDIPRSMVYIECLIMEVNVEKGFELGTEWVAGEDFTLGSKDWIAGGGFGGKGQYSNIGNLVATANAGAATFPAGYSMGVFGETIKVGDMTFASLGALINAMKSDKDVHILSTPQIITTDNEEAVITVGSNVPYLTKTGTTSSSETYNNYEYKDVGFTLKVTPQISKDGLVRLKIYQEINKLDQAAISQLNTGEITPTTLKRTIETTVIINDKNTIAIGGLIDDSITKSESAVPCLGSVPLLGYLFKSISESGEKTNLYFFLTPHVIRGPEDSETMKNNKKADIEKLMKEGRIKMYGGSSGQLHSDDENMGKN
ncbi:MAG: type II secretion system protein GspD [Desulfobacteraceae bacterium]|nr:MAG: type II secretion system protein GspD [Desulfobacteraceae bacterium]